MLAGLGWDVVFWALTDSLVPGLEHPWSVKVSLLANALRFSFPSIPGNPSSWDVF